MGRILWIFILAGTVISMRLHTRRQENIKKEQRQAPRTRKNASFALGTRRRRCDVSLHAIDTPQDQARKIHARHSAHNGYPGLRGLSAFPFWSSINNLERW